jgi:hypothetical protein
MKETNMIRFTTALAVVAIAIAAPIAQAEPSFGSSVPLDPAIASAIQAHHFEYRLHDLPLTGGVQADSKTVSLDPAIASAIQTRRESNPHHLTHAATNVGPLDPAIARATQQRNSGTRVATAATSSFNWSDFALGAGAMLFVAVVLGSLLTIKSKQSTRLSV